MEAHMIIGIVMLLFIFGSIVTIVGFVRFKSTIEKEYALSTWHIAQTAASLVDGDELDSYLLGENQEEYLSTEEALDAYCEKMRLSMIYVIQADTGDYGSFVSVFNAVDNTVDDTSYVEWESGYRRETTNEEYRQKYQKIYEEGSGVETVIRDQLSDGSHPHITTMVPVYNSEGVVAGILCIQRPAREIREMILAYVNTVIVTLLVLSVLASFAAIAYNKRQFAVPIRKISEEATRFAHENTKGEPLGEISRYAAISNLAVSIDKMEADILESIEQRTKGLALREKIRTELSLASQIQENAIPNEFPAFPDKTTFDIYASMTPAKAIGGDFYNFFLVDENHLAIMIGDVSGKGIPAALFMMANNIMLKDRTAMGGTPAEIFTTLNTEICKNNTADMFLTVWLGILDLTTGVILAANAGHEYPVLMQDGTFALMKDKHGFLLGIMDNMKYENYEIRMKPGDKLFLYTDGVPEASDRDNQMFGAKRMVAALNRNPADTPKELLENVRCEVDEFVRDAEQFDDLTMLCVEYKGDVNSQID